MNKKIMAILTLLVVAAFAWLNWGVIPNYGVVVLRITLPFYITFIGLAWGAGYLISDQFSQKRVKHAEDRAQFARHQSCEIMLKADERVAFYKAQFDDAEKIKREILEARERLEAERKAKVQEIEELHTLREKQQKYEDLERRLECTEKENNSLKGVVKRLKAKITDLQNPPEDPKESD